MDENIFDLAAGGGQKKGLNRIESDRSLGGIKIRNDLRGDRNVSKQGQHTNDEEVLLMEGNPYQQPAERRKEPRQRRRMQSQEPSGRKAPVPKRDERLELNDRIERNAIKDNMHKVIYDNSQAIKARAKVEDKKQNQNLPGLNKNYGKVPSYINKYNQQREDAAIQRMMEEERSKIPAGTRLMPEEERVETLRDLQESRKEINTALEKLPVVSKTMAMEKHKKELESKMARVDRAIETFSKKTVYVAF